MTSAVDIANRALSEMGTQSTISSFDDGSVEGAQCALWYDKLRRGLLRTAHWGFARYQLTLTQLGDRTPDATSPYPWAYKYAYPSTAIALRYVLCPPPANTAPPPPQVGLPVGPAPWLFPSRANRFLIGADVNTVDGQPTQSKVVLSNVYQAIGVFTLDVTDPDLFDDLFDVALTAALAYKLVIPLSGNTGLKQSFMAEATAAIAQARAADANEAMPSTDATPDWITTRGAGGPFYGQLASDWGQWYGGWTDMAWGG